jgi:uncharacterized protein (TIGR03546 family)
MLTRRIGSLVRGRITPLQVMFACVLGSMLGFVPGFTRAPGAVVALSLALLVLNAPLGLALGIAALAKLLSLLALPLSFTLGRALLDGPTQGLFRAAVNAPVLALFGFEHYAVTGGLLLGALVGVGAGLLVARAVRIVRLRLAAASTDHAAFAAIQQKGWAKALAFLFIGKGHGTMDWAQLAELKGGKPVRVAGVVVALVLVGAFLALHSALTGPLLASALRRGLAEANGATVDIGSASLDLTEGRLAIQGLALADPNALDRDLFRAAELTADVSGLDLLRRRVRLEHVVAREAFHGAPRQSPGSLVGWRAEEPPPPVAEGGERTLEDYLRDYELWRDRLAQVRRWLEKLAPKDEPVAGEAGGEAAETLEERLEREAEQSGYANVVARHLVEGSPTLLVSQLTIEGLLSESLPGEVIDVRAENLSTQPSLVAGAPHVSMTSRSGNLLVDVGLGGLARRDGTTAGATAGTGGDGASGGKGVAGAGAGEDRVAFRMRALPVDRIADSLSVGGQSPVSGGTLDVELDGRWAGGVGHLDLPLAVTLHDSTLHLGGRDAKVASFTLPIGLRGPLDGLRLTIDDDHLVEALKAAGAAELSRRVDEERDKLMEKASEKVGEELDQALDKAAGKAAEKGIGDALGGLLGGKKKDKKDG